MEEISIMGLFFLMFSWLLSSSYALLDSGLTNNSSFFTVSSYRYPKSEVRPYDTRYIRVDLPQWFSSINVELESDVDISANTLMELPKSLLPVICFRDGSPPLPDVSNNALKSIELGRFFNGSFEGEGDVEIAEQCYPMQKNISLRLTNEQISPGAWYVGLFNGIGDTRTQGKMIVRSSGYSFSANISVEGCKTSTMWGPFCNQTIYPLSCSRSDNQTGSLVSCIDSFSGSCLSSDESRVYSLDIDGISEQLIIKASDVELDSVSRNANGSAVMCYARYGAIASDSLYDFTGDIHKSPLVINTPKAGRWYIVARYLDHGTNSSSQVCFSIDAEVIGCPVGKAGSNCGQQIYMLEAVMRKGSNSPFESYYMPMSSSISMSSSNMDFPIELISSNFSSSPEVDMGTWTYFLMNVPRGAAGGHIHIRLTSDSKIHHQVFVRYGGFPSIENRDYYFVNRTSSSASSSMFFKLYDLSQDKVDFYILYAREGTWVIGLRQFKGNSSDAIDPPTLISLSLERCPKRCSSPHGSCKFAFDASGLTSYSFCSCDRTHGGIDCGIEIVSHRGHVVQSIALIVSNAAALLPAYWALRQRDYAEWVLFTSSGISSALYHACDVGTWCALNYNVLQFMDFWLSFMAVVSTFVYLSTADEAFKRTIHTVVAILTALLALTKATRASNIAIVFAIGSFGLLLGFLVELSRKYRSFCETAEVSLSLISRPWAIKEWLGNMMKTLKKRLRWSFVVAGLITLAFAGICFKVETPSTYWIWHSIWHVAIYTSSFFFLCSKIATVNSEHQEHGAAAYELTRQDSLPRT